MIQDLRDNIQHALSQVNFENAPKTYNAIKLEVGYKIIEQRIIKMMIQENITASSCIVHIEKSL